MTRGIIHRTGKRNAVSERIFDLRAQRTQRSPSRVSVGSFQSRCRAFNLGSALEQQFPQMERWQRASFWQNSRPRNCIGGIKRRATRLNGCSPEFSSQPDISERTWPIEQVCWLPERALWSRRPRQVWKPNIVPVPRCELSLGNASRRTSDGADSYSLPLHSLAAEPDDAYSHDFLLASVLLSSPFAGSGSR